MSDIAVKAGLDPKRLKKRYRKERCFRFYGILSIFLALLFLFSLLFSIFYKGYSAFEQTTLRIPIYFDVKIIDPDNQLANDQDVLHMANYTALIYNSLAKIFNVDPSNKLVKKQLKSFYSNTAPAILEHMVVNDPSLLGQQKEVEFLASADIDAVYKGQIDLSVPQSDRKVSDLQISWLEQLKKQGLIYGAFNKGLFINSASSNPEKAGLATAFIGSLYMMAIVLALALPLGVATSIYLEEYAKKSRFIDFLEININNLAAVPSIVYGLLGLSIFLDIFGLPRSSSLVGGLVLAFTTLPTIIISTRSALQTVPPSIKSGAMALGASKSQVVFHHCLPYALPGILTGSIISIAQAMGQTAPLLLIGMVAFVANYPVTPMDPATALPVQIYIWSEEMHRSFVERTSAAIIVLLAFLMLMNLVAIILRRHFEKRR